MGHRSGVLNDLLRDIRLRESGRFPRDPMECHVCLVVAGETRGGGDRDLDHNLITSPLAFHVLFSVFA